MGWKLIKSIQGREVQADLPDDLSREDFDFIRRFVYEESGIHLGPEKRSLVVHRLLKRVRQLGLRNISDYCALIRSRHGAAELGMVLDLLTTNVTHFFREPEHFDFLAAVVRGCRKEPAAKSKPLFTAWSAACSSGQEPYSMAIVLAEYAREHPGFRWSVEATDISRRMLEKAVQGIYREEELKLPNALWRARYFQRGVGTWTGHYRVKPELRAHVHFRRWNLLDTPYPFDTSFDIIFCRNVMIYFDRRTQQRVVENLTRQLRPGGYLIVGHSESLLGLHPRLHCIQPSVYRHEQS